jgi:hypothetical protein
MNGKGLIMRYVLLVLMIVLIIIHPAAAQDDDQPSDLLAYISSNHELRLYNPSTDTHTTVLEDFCCGFHFNSDRQIAWSERNEDGESYIFVLDIHTPDRSPVNISEQLNLPGQVLGWSRDGRYLVFVSPRNFFDVIWHMDESGTPIPLYEPTLAPQDIRSIYVWDGERAINITPDELVESPESYSVAWSYDGQLAFTVCQQISDEYSEYEIYLWDGNTTVNLSQNPGGIDQYPKWSNDNQIIFSSLRDGEQGAYLWDGVSYKDGLPDADTFIDIKPDGYVSMGGIVLNWTHDGRWSFSGSEIDVGGYAHPYIWDGEDVIDISEDPELHHSSPIWSPDSRYYALVTYWSSRDIVIIRDVDNNTILTTSARYGAGWSLDGKLAYCVYGPPFTLEMWNGEDTIPVTQGNTIFAQWQGGEVVSCYNG